VNKEAKNEKNKLKKDVMKNMKPSSVPAQYECDQCDEKYESLCKLKSHIRTFHMKTIYFLEHPVIFVTTCLSPIDDMVSDPPKKFVAKEKIVAREKEKNWQPQKKRCWGRI
jgi:hypothetical protein